MTALRSVAGFDCGFTLTAQTADNGTVSKEKRREGKEKSINGTTTGFAKGVEGVAWVDPERDQEGAWVYITSDHHPQYHKWN